MRLKTAIFLWIFVATVLPLTALVLATTSYSERRYWREVDREVQTSLSNLASELERRLLFEREVVRALSQAPAMRAYIAVLAADPGGARGDELERRGARLAAFLEGFQAILPSLSTFRVLSAEGHTLLKVQGAARSPAIFEGISPYPLVEPELTPPALGRRLEGLPAREVSFVTLPAARRPQRGQVQPALMEAVVPFRSGARTAGYLAAHLRGEQLDRILDTVPRVYDGRLMVAEINPDDPRRNGVLLYDDARGLHFADARFSRARVQSFDDGRLWRAVQGDAYGAVTTHDGRYRAYYQEYFPYPNQLVSWLIVTRLDRGALSAPFTRIRLGIGVLAAAALALSLLLAHAGARSITAPVSVLAGRLKAYGRGERAGALAPRGPREVRQLTESFNDMAESLERAEAERDRAQHAAVQKAKLASIGELAAGVGHEINNPLNNILSLAKLVERGLPPEAARGRADLASLREEALRASRIVRGVLNFARQVPPELAPFEIRPWLEETVGLVRRTAAKRGVRLELYAGAEGEMEGDRAQL
ncbi:MAG: HAMP domain-containing histidine kinase, partial [Gammaproteobacteria bacterium]|nr:HAMP domain-containing histidine kinase [Gammaproteobacteria bacterium]